MAVLICIGVLALVMFGAVVYSRVKTAQWSGAAARGRSGYVADGSAGGMISDGGGGSFGGDCGGGGSSGGGGDCGAG
jgi:hypothetical protein